MGSFDILNFISKVPDTVWAAVIASLLTLGGVALTNKGSFKRLAAQLKHEKFLKDRDRNMEIRRQVFLDAAAAINENHQILLKISDLNIPDSELSNTFTNSSSKISKVNVIASSKTVRNISKLTSSLGKNFLFLTAERLPLIQRRSEISALNDYFVRLSSERDHLIEIRRNFSLQDIKNEEKDKLLDNLFTFHQNKIDEILNRRNELIARNKRDQLELFKKCFQASKESSKYFPPAIQSVRDEMDISFNQDEYREIIEKEWNTMEEALNEFFNRISHSTIEKD